MVRDLTQGSIVRHILTMAGPIAFGMTFQTLYHLVDMYFVAGLGKAAIAGVNSSGNAMFLIVALTQVLGVGSVALISHAVGRKDRSEANLIFNQSLLLSALCGGFTVIAGYLLTQAYMRSIAADEATVEAGTTYLYWFLPGLALQFAMVAMSAALRATGIVKPAIVVQIVSVLLNVLLAPILIAGWGTGRPMGVAGAGLASTLSIAVAVLLLGLYFVRVETYVAFNRQQWRPQTDKWKRMLAIGLPAGGEFLLLFVFAAVIYWCIREFGAEAQASYGIGARVTQAIILPALAISFAASPIVGQNFGAGLAERVRETFAKTVLMSSLIMVVLTAIAHWRPEFFFGAFAEDASVRENAAVFFRICSWNFITQGVIFSCSSIFQGLGDTRPALLTSVMRVVMFAVPGIWLSTQPDFTLEHLWYLSVATTALQAGASVWLLLRKFRRQFGAVVAIAA